MAAIARTLRQLGRFEGGLYASIAGVVSLWLARVEARREFAGLSDRMLADIGLDPEETRKDVEKPFWRA